MDFRSTVNSVLKGAYGPIDSNGVPQVNYGGNIGVRYNPTTIAEFALGNYQLYFDNPKNNHKNLKQFNSSVDWLAANYSEKNNKVYWFLNFDWPLENLRHPWYSGMTQGLCISVLVRAFLITGNQSLSKLTEGGLAVLTTEISGGGALFKEHSNCWIEEYPNLNHEPSHVLNGFIYGLFGVHDYLTVKENLEGKKLWSNAVETLEKNLRLFDVGYWSKYDLKHKTPASLMYHNLHVKQLRSLFRLSGNPIFELYAIKWENYKGYPKNVFKSQLIYYTQSALNFKKSLGLKNGLKGGTVALIQSIRK